MPLTAGGYDPDTLAMLYRVLDTAFHRAGAHVSDEGARRLIREKLARALIRAYEDGEQDPELLATIAVNSLRRGS
jgi:hypothetical protein